MMTDLNATGISPPKSILISRLLRDGPEGLLPERSGLWFAYADLIEDVREERRVSKVLMRTIQFVVRLAICMYAALNAGEIVCCPGPPILVAIALRAT